MTPRLHHLPLSTYRLQFNASFTFQDASRILPYLSHLGITDCYASPYLKAAPGSTHGYDVVDPTELNPEIGTEADYQAFIKTLHDHDMGQILDIVPNHMSIAESTNLWWQDVLENGPSSRYAMFFDIDWTPVKPELENKVLLPILGDQYGIVLENQEISLHYDDGLFFLLYYEHRFPIDPCTWNTILTLNQDSLIQNLEESNPHLQEYQSIITALSHLPVRTETDPERVAERYREKEVIHRRLATVMAESSILHQFLLENIRLLNGVKNSPRSFDVLDHLVSAQAYRLAYWRVAAEEINYRRFFDINQLAAIRMEQPEVFEAAHQKIFELVASGAVNGLRIDHVDGLYNPRAFLAQWQQWAVEHLNVQPDGQGRALYLLVEKILGTGEHLSPNWLCHGTTGYDHLAFINQLFIPETHLAKIEQIYTRFTKQSFRYDDLIYDCKNLIMTSSMSGEINALGHQLNVLSERNRRSRDFTLNSLIHAIREIIACFPVYRTYIEPDPLEVITDRDRAYIRLAVARAKRRNPAISNLVFDFIRDLLLKLPQDSPDLDWDVIRPFVMKFQQTTSPVTAKGVEDTAFYIYNRMISLNEVGGEPEHFGISLSVFHHYMQERAAQWPTSLSSTSTHDTKRSEDVRARISVLSEIPHEWRQHLKTWSRLNKKVKQSINDQLAPSLNEEYFLYQTLLGAWPFGTFSDSVRDQFLKRIQEYAIKALREAKVNTSWLNPDEAYEAAVANFLSRILSLNSTNVFLRDFFPFQQRLAKYGMYNSLSQVLIKILTPGVPDLYQGTELWDFSLVDPDNRQPVDYLFRQQRLSELHQRQKAASPLDFVHMLLQEAENGLIKMYLTTTALHVRKRNPQLFLKGSYLPLEAKGDQEHHVCGFIRQDDANMCLTVFPRFLTGLIPDPSTSPLGETIWGQTWMALPPELSSLSFRNIFTQETVTPQNHSGMLGLPVRMLFQHFPFALLEPVS
jgi:(1->4)-alpha-D-glucan 1-alpha-D-glucosylmutase